MLVLLVCALPASAATLPILASHDWWPVYSPDAQSIAFTRVNGQGRVFTLEVVAAGGGGRVVRLAQASSQLMPSWSPDSSRIAYQSGGRIYTVARDGSGRRFVTTGLYPDWSPDGTSIAYVRARRAAGRREGARDAGDLEARLVAGRRVDRLRALRRDPRRDEGRCRAHGRANRAANRVVRSGRSTGRSSRTPSAGACTSSRPTEQRRARLVAGPFRTLSPLSWAPTGDALSYTADGSGAADLAWSDVAHGDRRRQAEVGAVVLPRRSSTAT